MYFSHRTRNDGPLRALRHVRAAALAVSLAGCASVPHDRTAHDNRIEAGADAAQIETLPIPHAPIDPSGEASRPSPPYDPWEPFNRRVHRFNTAIDRTVARPVAKAYVAVVPAPARARIGNIFDNLGQPATAVNALLQGRVGHSMQALGRFVLNSTVGIAGLFDPASRLHLQSRDEDFGQTLARWGWRRSRYIELPFFGPGTLRDVVGMLGDSPLQPLAYVEDDAVRYGIEALGLVDGRARALAFDAIRQEAEDEYLLIRDTWTQRRNFQISQDTEDGAALPDYLDE